MGTQSIYRFTIFQWEWDKPFATSIKTDVDILCSSGAKGCRFNQVKVDAKEISVVNTNGAGDALVGIFLSYYNSIPQQEALKKAVDYATEVCQIGGPRI